MKNWMKEAQDEAFWTRIETARWEISEYIERFQESVTQKQMAYALAEMLADTVRSFSSDDKVLKIYIRHLQNTFSDLVDDAAFDARHDKIQRLKNFNDLSDIGDEQ